jgi:sarcosine oxidase gamma subunit
MLLHFAPRRWLVPAPDAALLAGLNDLAGRGLGTLVDVEGKWHKIHAAGPGAAQAIASTISVKAVLGDRGCAAVTLFDSPAVLARHEAAFDLWVAASYLDHFLDVTRNLRLPT